ncbi:MAG: family 43 glycosylhydrolase [Clostridiales bacterium]|jgi:beta-xylosidase|nr:putative 1,4-beta-xylosidase [uncultured bacterium]NLK03698.1 family 43 glycosylhydrolase [Clostridiales bacterium]
MSKHAKQNEPLVTHLYTADPSAHVFEDKIYIYPSHDLEHDGVSDDEGTQYTMEDYHVFSMDDIDAPVVDHGQVLHMKDVPWVSQQMWAPDAAFKNDTYYFYFPAKDKEGIFRIGVATSDNPAGPFKPEPNYIPGSYSIDPAVFIDDDGKAYMYAGGLWGGQLEKWQTGKFDPDAGEQNPDEIALGPWVAPMSDDMLTFAEPPVEFKILDENGKPLLAGDEDRRFFEAPWVHKYNGTYYLSYSTGSSHYIVYATSDNPMGPFTYRGRILEPVVGWTTHQSIVEFKGKWYLFYHDASLSGGIDHRRSIKFTEIKYNEDGTIQTIHPYK